jgi:hypothetical protein
LIGAGFAAGSSPLLGFGAALMAVFVAYVRALGASVGAGQVFVGPQAKPQRMAVVTAACVLSAIVPALNAVLCVIVTALWIVILGGAITVVRRFVVIARFLRNKTS